MNRGTTLLELIFALALVSSIAGVGLRATRRAADAAAVVSAREALVGLVTEARLHAMASGGASVEVVASERSIGLRIRDQVAPRTTALPHDINLRVSPRRDTLRLRFDALGIGRFASASISFQRGDAVRSVTVSSYGRVSRR